LTLPYHFPDIRAKYASDLNEFSNVQKALPAFILRHERLRLIQRLSHLSLRQASLPSSNDKLLEQDFV